MNRISIKTVCVWLPIQVALGHAIIALAVDSRGIAVLAHAMRTLSIDTSSIAVMATVVTTN
jgi:hypothetical protein